MHSPLSSTYYQQEDVVALAKDLIGRELYTCYEGTLTGGRIVETEAYAAPEDRASHAYKMRRTPRTEVMFHAGGVAYVTLCYGLHCLFNVVTNREGIPHAVLIRAVEPLVGIPLLLERRKLARRKDGQLPHRLLAGPGALTQGLGIGLTSNGAPLHSPELFLAEGVQRPSPEEIVATPRVGIEYAQEWREKCWRFYLRDNPFVSKVNSRNR